MAWLKHYRVGKQAWILLAMVVAISSGAPAADEAPTAIKLGVRPESPPFSEYEEAPRNARGYSVDLCREIAENAARMYPDLYRGIIFEPVSAQDRFTKLHGGQIDILCEATTVTQERMRRFGPTMYTFISGASLMYSPKITGTRELTVGVLKGTTTELAIRSIMDRQSDIDLRNFKPFRREELNTHQECFQAFSEGRINVYMADREILLALSKRALEKKNRQQLIVSKNYYTIEPYALFLRVDDHQLRYVANLTLSEVFKADIHQIFVRNFPGNRMNDSLRQLFRLQQLLRGSDPLPGEAEPHR